MFQFAESDHIDRCQGRASIENVGRARGARYMTLRYFADT